jgi:hypothetical protein
MRGMPPPLTLALSPHAGRGDIDARGSLVICDLEFGHSVAAEGRGVRTPTGEAAAAAAVAEGVADRGN